MIIITYNSQISREFYSQWGDVIDCVVMRDRFIFFYF